MNKFSLTYEERDILKYLILQGTSDLCRLRLWLVCSGAQTEIKLNPSYYNDLLKLSKEVPSLYSSDIEKDLDRTNQILLKENKIYKEMLKNILTCYSLRNSSIGYCQGFNFIVLRIIEITQNEVIIFLFNFYLIRNMLFGYFVN